MGLVPVVWIVSPMVMLLGSVCLRKFIPFDKLGVGDTVCGGSGLLLFLVGKL